MVGAGAGDDEDAEARVRYAMPQDRDDELAREIRTHLELEAEEGVDAGLSAERGPRRCTSRLR